MGVDKSDDSKLKEAILSALRGAGDDNSMAVKALRKEALLSVQGDEDEKSDRKAFKKATKTLEKEGALTLSEDGVAKLTGKGKKEKKRQASEDDGAKGKKKQKTGDEDEEAVVEAADDSQEDDIEEEHDPSKNEPCKGNPNGCTRLFLGNLPFKVDEASLNDFLSGGMTHVKWITDTETGKFYGSAFVEVRNSKVAAEAVAKAGTKLMGRPIKLNFAPARSGDIWPPKKREVKGSDRDRKGGQAGGAGKTAMSAKPDGCTKLFIGNLSYKVDDEEISKFFDTVGSEVKTVRFLYHQDSGDPKGVGFVEFWDTDACDKAATLNGKNLLGRPIRIDWTD